MEAKPDMLEVNGAPAQVPQQFPQQVPQQFQQQGPQQVEFPQQYPQQYVAVPCEQGDPNYAVQGGYGSVQAPLVCLPMGPAPPRPGMYPAALALNSRYAKRPEDTINVQRTAFQNSSTRDYGNVSVTTYWTDFYAKPLPSPATVHLLTAAQEKELEAAKEAVACWDAPGMRWLRVNDLRGYDYLQESDPYWSDAAGWSFAYFSYQLGTYVGPTMILLALVLQFISSGGPCPTYGDAGYFGYAGAAVGVVVTALGSFFWCSTSKQNTLRARIEEMAKANETALQAEQLGAAPVLAWNRWQMEDLQKERKLHLKSLVEEDYMADPILVSKRWWTEEEEQRQHLVIGDVGFFTHGVSSCCC